MNEIKDIALAPDGEVKINWVRRNMPVLRGIEADFAREKPFAGMKIALSVHLEAKTAYLCRVLAAGGAEMYVTGSKPALHAGRRRRGPRRRRHRGTRRLRARARRSTSATSGTSCATAPTL